MYAVIFKAEFSDPDKSYSEMAVKLQQLAIEKYGCTEFIAVTEGKREIAISYWESLEQIASWKQDVLHLSAQKIGRHKWYKNYQVQVMEIKHEYSMMQKEKNS